MNKEISKIEFDFNDLHDHFKYINSIIESHRSLAITSVNNETLASNWEVGQYISNQLKSSNWGDKIISELANYLQSYNPGRRGYSKRNLYNMVNFYESYSDARFIHKLDDLQIDNFVQLTTAQNEATINLQLPTANLNPVTFHQLPAFLTLTSFTNHVEILNRCKSVEERIFYVLYAHQNHLNLEELRRCIVAQTYATLLDKDKMFSPKLREHYPNSEYLLKDKAIVDFLNLPVRHNEHKLHAEILKHMKEFILEIGKDFLFVDTEYPVEVGGSTKRIDLLFYHRLLQCLVAIELKAVDFEPEFIGKMDMYLEALDRDIKHDNENPSIGIILCPSADRSMVEYTLSRSLSPTMVAEYKRKLIPQDVLQASLNEYCKFLAANK